MQSYYCRISQQRSSSEQFYSYGLMKMSETIIFIKRNVVDWQSTKMKNLDTFEIFNHWNTLYLFLLYSVSILVLRTMKTPSPMFSGINDNNLFLFSLKDKEKCNISVMFVCTAFFKNENIFKYFFHLFSTVSSTLIFH